LWTAGALVEGRDAEEATDVVWSLCSNEPYRLVERRGSAARNERWLAESWRASCCAIGSEQRAAQ
jgi:hypothetical protein